MKKILITGFLSFAFCCELHAETQVWNGEVNSNGTPSPSVELKLGKTYFLRVSQDINLGKWSQQGEKLANDACYEFSTSKSITKLETFKNSQGLSVCDGSFHPNHIYESEPFVAKQNRIHFWISDSDYDDNIGSFHVQVFQVTDKKEGE